MNPTFHILALDGISSKGLEIFAANKSFNVVVKPPLKEAELITQIVDVDAVIARSQTKITASAIAAARRLKVIGRAGVGVDSVDVEAATGRGIVVMNTPGGNTTSTAEHAFSLLLSLARHIPQAHASMRAGEWDRKSFSGVEISNKVLGIIGMGRIGGEVARRAIAFGMRVMAYDPYLTLSRAKSLQVELVDQLDPLLEQSDFITLHMPLTEETKGILNERTLDLCKKGVRIINGARGGLVEEKALYAAIQSGQVAGAALDVYEQEPPPPDLPFRPLPNVVLTPHLGASTAEAQVSVGVEICQAVHDFLIDRVVRNAVNMPSVDTYTLGIIRPYLQLGEKLGRFISQLAPPRLENLVVRYSGPVNEVDTTPVTRSILKGLLVKSRGSEVNEVNAPHFARTQGLTFSEIKISGPADFRELVSVEAVAGAEKHEISGTFFGSEARIVRVDGFSLEALPDGILMLLENEDRPGMIGWIGTLLGKHGVNIANMSLSRNEVGQRALSVYNLDSAPDESVLAEIAKEPGISSVKIIRL
jgi:D-3-phosphoglycerate dehydrogenase / 2-oxoglutarate reductase